MPAGRGSGTSACLRAARRAARGRADERTLLEGVPSVFAASKYDQPLTEAPADVSIVTRAEILRYGWRTLADVLRGVRGFLVTNDRNYAYAGVRGFARTGDYNGRILLHGRRPPRQRHDLRPGAARHRRAGRPGPGRAGGDRARRRFVALRQQRVLRRDQPHHAARTRRGRRRRRRCSAGRKAPTAGGSRRATASEPTASTWCRSRRAGPTATTRLRVSGVRRRRARQRCGSLGEGAGAVAHRRVLRCPACSTQRTKTLPTAPFNCDLRRQPQPDDRHARLDRRPLPGRRGRRQPDRPGGGRRLPSTRGTWCSSARPTA